MNISTILTKDLDKEKQATLRNQFSSNKLLFRTLKKVMKDKIENSQIEQDNFNLMDYDKLALSMAFFSGYRKALRELIELLPKEDK